MSVIDNIELLLQYVALCGVAVLLVVLIIAALIRGAAAAKAQLSGFWREIGLFGRVFAVVSVVALVMYAGEKTNSPPRGVPGPVLRRLRQTLTDAEKFAANWNARGAWQDSFKCDFEDGWEFPCGTNHLVSVEVISQGKLWPKWNDTNAVADVGVPLAIVPGLTTFGFEHTQSNSCRFTWTDAAVDRDTNNLTTASIELFRNGDVAATTNGAAVLTPRELPFAHDGFGQDAEWVAANFTNAAEILSVGYPQWVDAQVGDGLQNGLYKLTVEVPDDPPEVIDVSVGEYSMAVTNAGEYVFLLRKGVNYDLFASSNLAEGFIYSAVDDVPAMRGGGLRSLRRTRSAPAGDGEDDGRWIVDSGYLNIFAPFGFVFWAPELAVSPESWHPSPANATRTFSATLSDIHESITQSYMWTSGNGSVCSVANATDSSATFTCHFPAAFGQDVSLGLDVGLFGGSLNAQYECHVGSFAGQGEYVEVQTDSGFAAGLAVVASPTYVFFEKGSTGAKTSSVGCFYQASEAGTFELSVSGDPCTVTGGSGPVSGGCTWDAAAGESGAKYFNVARDEKSTSPSGTVFTVTFTPDEGTNTMESAANVVFVEWETETVADWPEDKHRKTIGVCEIVEVRFDPNPADLMLSNQSQDAKLKKEDGAFWKYTAPPDPMADVISVVGYGNLFEFDIFAPVGYEAKLTSIYRHPDSDGEAGNFAMLFDLTLLPTNVSFEAIQVLEEGLAATNATGYFAEPRNENFLFHLTGDVLYDVYRGNKQTDLAQIAELDPPWGDGGSMTWPIPNKYASTQEKVVERYFCNTDQNFSVTPSGTATETKFGWFATATTNRNFTFGRINEQ